MEATFFLLQALKQAQAFEATSDQKELLINKNLCNHYPWSYQHHVVDHQNFLV